MKCEICGTEFDKIRYGGDSINICSLECHNKKFWKDIIKNKHEHVVVNGTCYYVGKENSTSDFRGFGGRKFFIKNLATGEIVKSTNLWLNGEVPEEFRDELPDTSEFVKESDV